MRKIILLTSIILVFVSNYSEAQEYWELETVIPSEVSHFKVGLKSDVSATGALNISIPLLTIPGRGGLDFPITLNYTSGIKTRQQASWVGLGWSLDFGSITRVVRLLPDYDSVRTEKLNKDYPDYYLVSLPQFSSVMYQMDTIRTNPPRFVLENSSSYRIEARYKAFNGFRIAFNNNYSKNYDSDYYLGSDNWEYGTTMVFDNNPFNGTNEGHRDTTFRDIDKFILTSSDGTRYVFGLPLRSEDRMGGIVMEHNSNWRLTAILSSDFVDGGGDTLNPVDVNETSCKGSWIYVKYRSVDNMRLRKFENPNLLMQVSYPDTIYTPTHKATFTTSTRYDIGFVIPEPYIESGFPYNAFDLNVLPRKLDKIELFERSSNKKIQRFDFVYSPKASQLAHAYDNTLVVQGIPCDSLGKLTLYRIIPYDTNSVSENYYQFEYHKFNPLYYDTHFYEAGLDPVDLTAGFPTSSILRRPDDPYFRRRTDLFGLFYGRRSELANYCGQYQLGADSVEVMNTDGAVAYSLKKIIYPTGGSEYYEYEKNQFDSLDKDISKWGPGAIGVIAGSGNGIRPNGECGIRIKRKTISKGDSTAYAIDYQYGKGHLSAPSVNAYRYSSYIFRVMDWGKNAVEYEWIQETYGDNSKIKKTYYFPNTYFYNRQQKFVSENIHNNYTGYDYLVVETSQDWMRNNVRKIEYFKSLGQRTQSSDNLYSYIIKDTMKTFYKEYDESNTYFTTMYSGLALKNTQIDTVYDQSGNNPLSKNTSFVYTLKGLPRCTTEYNSDGRMKKVFTDYMLADSVSYSGVTLDLFNKNMYSAIKAKRLYQDDTLKNYTEYNYKVFDAAWTKRIYIDKKYQWRDVNSNNAVDSGELLTTAVVDSLDNYGNPLIVSDPNGVKSYFTWYQNSKLASKTKFNQKVSYTYNPFHQVRSIIDENNNETRYIYDNFWRLRQIIGPDGKILKEYQYNYKK